MKLTAVDWLIMLVYFGFVLGIGVVLKRYTRTSKDFFRAGQSMPAWVAGLAFISANLGAQEVLGMGASGAKYGIATSHFYWVGAIPAMVFVGVFMMPFYYGSKARSVPEYLRLRFDEKTRALNAVTFAVMTVISSGISMFAMAELIQTLHIFDTLFDNLGIPKSRIFDVSVLISAIIVLAYIFLGGLTSAIYNEVLQFFLIVAGFVPLVFLGLHQVGGWSGIVAHFQAMPVPSHGPPPLSMVHSWAYMGSPDSNPLGVEWFGMVMGLGFVLSFGYWCTDFLVIQRAMAAESMGAARRTPLIAAIPKMFFPFLVIMPGLIAICASSHVQGGLGLIPPKLTTAGQIMFDTNHQPVLDYNLAIPQMLLTFFPTGMLGIGLTALLASFMSGMAGNVTAFNTVWTYDIYQSYIRKEASDEHYLWMGRAATVFGIAFSILAAYVAANYNSIMDVLQTVFAFVNAPLFATFLLGMFWKRTTGHGAFFGLLSGMLAAAVHHGLTLPYLDPVGLKGGWLGVHHIYPSEMAQNFWTAIVAWTTCFVVTIAISLVTNPRPEEELHGLVYSLTDRPPEDQDPWYQRPKVLGAIVLAMALVLNIVFW